MPYKVAAPMLKYANKFIPFRK